MFQCRLLISHESCDVKLLGGLVVGFTTVTSLQVPCRAEAWDAVPVKSDRFTAALYYTPACTCVTLGEIWRAFIVRLVFP